jgi:hypothetical protein
MKRGLEICREVSFTTILPRIISPSLKIQKLPITAKRTLLMPRATIIIMIAMPRLRPSRLPKRRTTRKLVVPVTNPLGQ